MSTRNRPSASSSSPDTLMLVRSAVKDAVTLANQDPSSSGLDKPALIEQISRDFKSQLPDVAGSQQSISASISYLAVGSGFDCHLTHTLWQQPRGTDTWRATATQSTVSGKPDRKGGWQTSVERPLTYHHVSHELGALARLQELAQQECSILSLQLAPNDPTARDALCHKLNAVVGGALPEVLRSIDSGTFDRSYLRRDTTAKLTGRDKSVTLEFQSEPRRPTDGSHHLPNPAVVQVTIPLEIPVGATGKPSRWGVGLDRAQSGSTPSRREQTRPWALSRVLAPTIHETDLPKSACRQLQQSMDASLQGLRSEFEQTVKDLQSRDTEKSRELGNMFEGVPEEISKHLPEIAGQLRLSSHTPSRVDCTGACRGDRDRVVFTLTPSATIQSRHGPSTRTRDIKYELEWDEAKGHWEPSCSISAHVDQSTSPTSISPTDSVGSNIFVGGPWREI